MKKGLFMWGALSCAMSIALVLAAFSLPDSPVHSRGRIELRLLSTVFALAGLAAFVVMTMLSLFKEVRLRPEKIYAFFRAGRISKAPGSRLLSIVDFLFSAVTLEETFKPLVADWQTEYFDALKQKRYTKARWISVRYTYRFFLAMGLSKIFSVIKSFKSVIK